MMLRVVLLVPLLVQEDKEGALEGCLVVPRYP